MVYSVTLSSTQYPEGFPTPMIPEHPIVEETPQPPQPKVRHYSEEEHHHEPDIYVNVKVYIETLTAIINCFFSNLAK